MHEISNATVHSNSKPPASHISARKFHHYLFPPISRVLFSHQFAVIRWKVPVALDGTESMILGENYVTKVDKSPMQCSCMDSSRSIIILNLASRGAWLTTCKSMIGLSSPKFSKLWVEEVVHNLPFRSCQPLTFQRDCASSLVDSFWSCASTASRYYSSTDCLLFPSFSEARAAEGASYSFLIHN